MSRLLHAAARGARIEGLYQRGWIPVFAVRTDGLTDGQYKYRIHPDDQYLQYGPISTALRDCDGDFQWVYIKEDGTFIKPLIDAGLIEAHENGWIVIDPGTATGMMQAKK